MQINSYDSASYPLQIDEIPLHSVSGTIGVTFCPGKKDAKWDRDLHTDIGALRAWGTAAVVTLIEDHEFELLRVSELGARIREAGLEWLHLPIRDVNVPDGRFEAAWPAASAHLRELLTQGKNVVVHCRGGIGRAGTVTALLLVDLGMPAQEAIALVRTHRHENALETPAQVQYALSYESHMLDRAQGCLVGLAIGDACGTTLEFTSRDTYAALTDIIGGGPFRLKPGEWTDDTSMALCLAESLLACGTIDELDLMRRFLDWRDSGSNSVNGRCFDIGNTISAALSRFADTGEPVAGSRSDASAGNGSIMRLAPVALRWYSDPDAARDGARRQSRTTHGAAAAVEGCALLTDVLLDAIRTGDKQFVLRPRSAHDAVAAVASGSWLRSRDQIKSSGYVIDTLESALWSVHNADNFREAVLNAANLGGDADTVAAVAGQIAGALWGYSDIPKAWLSKLAWRARIEDLATELIDAARV